MTNLISLSIIIIGRNEGWKLTNCFRSVFETIAYNDVTNYEIIYVDSKSSDDSIERVMKYPEVRILQLTGDCNAAIARNVGAKESRGEILFFIDGDMELIPDAFCKFYDNEKGISHEFMSGNLYYNYYDNQWNLLKKCSNPHYNISVDTYQKKVGGLFFIARNLWQKIGGMRTKLDLGEDPDLALRLSKMGVLLFRKKDPLVIHHTIHYLNNKRKWYTIFKVSKSKSIYYRNNIINYIAIKQLLLQEYSMIFLIISIIISIFCSYYLILFYILIIIARSNRKKTNKLSNFFYYLIRDITIFIFLFSYWPSPKKIKYEILQ